MTRATITHVSTANGDVVHRLRESVRDLRAAHGKRTACGVLLNAHLASRGGHGMAGWEGFTESSGSFCSRCRAAA